MNAVSLPGAQIQQSAVRWTYQQLPLETLCSLAAEIGCTRIDVLTPEEFSVPARYGLRCSMGHVGLGCNKAVGINRTDYHDRFEAALRRNARVAEKHGVTNVIALCGPRASNLSDDDSAKNCIACLTRLARIAADHGLTICLEPQNSKRDHPGYMRDHRLHWICRSRVRSDHFAGTVHQANL